MLLTIQMSTESEVISALAAQQNASDQNPIVRPMVHELRMKNSVIYLDPPIEEARVNWYQMLDQWLANIYNLSRIQASRYDIGIRNVTDSDLIYQSVVCLL